MKKEKTEDQFSVGFLGVRKNWLVFATAIFICLVGLWAVGGVGRQTDLRMRRELLLQATDIASAISAGTLHKLSFTADDKGRPEFQSLCAQMRAYAEVAQIKSLYTMALRNGDIVFGPESLPEGHPYASPPGTVYQQPSNADFEIFRTGEPHIQGPFADEYGTFVSAASPVFDPLTGDVIAVVGIDVDASEWLSGIRRAQWGAGGIMLGLLFVLFIIGAVLMFRNRLLPDRSLRNRYMEPILCGFFLFMLTLVAAFVFDRCEREEQRRSYHQMVRSYTANGAREFDKLYRQINLTATFFESSHNVERDEFRTYIYSIIPECIAEGFFWLPEVAEPDAETFIQNVRGAGMAGFDIRREEEGSAQAASTLRTVSYPALYIEPRTLEETALGRDLYSHPVLSSAIRETLLTGMPTASEPIRLVGLPQAPSGIFIFTTVNGPVQKGLVAFAVRLNKLLGQARAQNEQQVGTVTCLFQLGSAQTSLSGTGVCTVCGATFVKGQESPLLLNVPVFRFGKAYILKFVPDKKWLADHPLRYGLTAVAVGLSITILVCVIMTILINRRVKLEQLVEDRTADLLESEEKLREAQTIAHIWRWDLDLASNRLDWSDGIAEGIELASSSVLSTYEGFLSLVHPDDKKVVDDLRHEACEQGDAEIRLLLPGDKTKWVSIIGRATERDAAGNPSRVVGTLQDITERKWVEEEKERLQVQLTQSQKMESVGRLAGGVAHDFNNMLGVILGHAEMAMEELPPNNPVYADFEAIRKAAQHSADLTRQLLAFARKQPIAPKLLDLNETIESLIKMMRRLIGEDIDLIWKPCQVLWPVKMDPSQIDQMLANLCVNARDAIKGSGSITIETDNASYGEEYCVVHPGFVAGDYAVLAVSDNGSGMDANTMSHLFEPFFTTKGIGKGTGLGLATVYGIVKQNRGFVNVYSEPGKGTTFRIYFPRETGGAADIREQVPAEVPLGKGETILLVEDEPALLEMTQRMLESLGYAPLVTTSSSEALHLAEENADKIQLLLTDVVMPEISGRDLAHQISSIYPKMKILFMSGYTANVIAQHGILDDGVHFIQKPFSMKGLGAKLREVLVS